MNYELHHVEHGQGTPLVFIHGFTVDHRLLLPLESAFASRPGWRRIYLDLPGHGKTSAPSCPATADAIADSVAATIDDLLGDAPFAVCGNSFGGQIARDAVARFGGRLLGLALIAPVVAPLEKRNRAIHRTFPPTDSEPIDLREQDPDLVAEFNHTAVEHSAAAWAEFNRHVAPGLAAHDHEFAERLLAAFDLTTTPEDRFDTFDRPALMITGRQDNSVGLEDQFALLRSYPRMSYVALDRAGHNVHLDQPLITRALLEGWLDAMA